MSSQSVPTRGVHFPEAPVAGLSYVGKAVQDELSSSQSSRYMECWNVNFGQIQGEIAQSPPQKYWGSAEITPTDTHSDECLPRRMYDVIARAQEWVDITSLSPPDGKFTQQFNMALQQLAKNAAGKPEPII